LSAGYLHSAEEYSYPLQPTADVGQSAPDLHLGRRRHSGLQPGHSSAVLHPGLPDCFLGLDLGLGQPGLQAGLGYDHPARLHHLRSEDFAVAACAL
jgi:hypothetical protein